MRLWMMGMAGAVLILAGPAWAAGEDWWLVSPFPDTPAMFWDAQGTRPLADGRRLTAVLGSSDEDGGAVVPHWEIIDSDWGTRQPADAAGAPLAGTSAEFFLRTAYWPEIGALACSAAPEPPEIRFASAQAAADFVAGRARQRPGPRPPIVGLPPPPPPKGKGLIWFVAAGTPGGPMIFYARPQDRAGEGEDVLLYSVIPDADRQARSNLLRRARIDCTAQTITQLEETLWREGADWVSHMFVVTAPKPVAGKPASTNALAAVCAGQRGGPSWPDLASARAYAAGPPG
jgi:hypothetical protein